MRRYIVHSGNSNTWYSKPVLLHICMEAASEYACKERESHVLELLVV
jgi:hypothetical protein